MKVHFEMSSQFRFADEVPDTKQEKKAEADKRYVGCILHVSCEVPLLPYKLNSVLTETPSVS